MRRPGFLLALVLMCLRGAAARAEEFPYRAFIVEDNAEVRSGPGDLYYSVMTLPRGELVDVYRHDPGGWCAIRPPRGAFSWVAAEFLHPTTGTLAIVVGDAVVARTGSLDSDIRDVIQVRLDHGETVELVDREPQPFGADGRLWYKIAPPPGEFRWVSTKQTDRRPPPRLPTKEEAAAEKPSTSATDSKWRAPGDPKLEPTATAPVDAPAPTDGALAGPAPEEFAQALEEIDLELSSIVIDEPTAWNLDGVSAKVEAMLAEGQTSAERGKARLLLNKIARFEEIQRQALERERNLARGGDALAQRSSIGTVTAASNAPTPPNGAAPLPSSSLNGRFDGTGRLIEVTSAKIGSPRFALVDEAGKLQYYVTPAPGISLRPYLGRQIGVSGALGYMYDRDARLVTARHITTLDGDSALR